MPVKRMPLFNALAAPQRGLLQHGCYRFTASNAHTMSLGCLIACAQLGGAQSSELVQLQEVRCGTIFMDAHCCSFTFTITHYNQSHQLALQVLHTDSCIIYT